MLITIIFIAAAVCIVASVVIEYRNRKQRKQRAVELQFTSSTKEFSVSEYMARMEQVGIEIMQEAKKKPKYQIILWAGLDGLRLNEDGTAEWIQRKEKKPKPPPDQSYVNVMPPYVPLMHNLFQQNMCCQDNTATLLALQIQQTQNMANAYRPPYMQATYPYYQSAVTQCCAMPPCGGMF